MISKETLIAWLYEHGKLTADLEFDIHDCFDAALDAALSAMKTMPGIGLLSTKKRLASFYAVCDYLDERVSRSDLEPTEAMVALSVLRMLSPAFRKAISEFDHQAARRGDQMRDAIPALAKSYLDSSRDFNTPLVAG